MTTWMMHEGTQVHAIGSMAAEIRRRLRAAGIESADQEAVWLMQHALGLTGLRLVVDRDRPLSEHDVAAVNALVARRVMREPLQYLLGTQEFCGLEFEVNAAVLIPRPETELMVREATTRLARRTHPIIVDVGTGSGCLAVSLARAIPKATLFASDLSRLALTQARRNAGKHGVDRSITFLEGDLLAPLTGYGLEGQVAAIVANLPYIAEEEWSTLQPEVRLYEPKTALVAGPRGMELHERLLAEAIPFLSPGGLLLMELGQEQSTPLVRQVESMPAYRSLDVIQDDAGIERVLIAERQR